MSVKISNNLKEIKLLLKTLKQELCQRVALRIEQRLEADVDRWLCRNHHQRRRPWGDVKQVPYALVVAHGRYSIFRATVIAQDSW